MSPPNLVEMKPIVPELLQEQATPENIVQIALELLLNPIRRQETLDAYKQMRLSLGEVGVCDRAASEIFQLLEARVRSNRQWKNNPCNSSYCYRLICRGRRIFSRNRASGI